MEEKIRELLQHRETFYVTNIDGEFIVVDMVSGFFEDIKELVDEGRNEGFDDGKDLARLLIQNTTKGLKPEEMKRLKELKLKYSIPSYE